MRGFSELFHEGLWAGRDCWLCPLAVVTQVVVPPGEGSLLPDTKAGSPGVLRGEPQHPAPSRDVPPGTAELVEVKDEPRRPLPYLLPKMSSKKGLVWVGEQERRHRWGEQPWGGHRDKFFPCLRVKPAASPLFGERRGWRARSLHPAAPNSPGEGQNQREGLEQAGR